MSFIRNSIMAAGKSLKRTHTCLIILGIIFIIFSFQKILPAFHGKRRELQPMEDLSREHTEKLLIASPNSPLGYPIRGVQVMPLNTINLPGLQINANLPEYTVSLEASLGTIGFPVNISGTSECQIQGKGEKHLTISTSSIRVLNLILNSITYTSTVYSIGSLDIVKFTLGEHIAQIPISIRQPPMPCLYDPGPVFQNIMNSLRVTPFNKRGLKPFIKRYNTSQIMKSLSEYHEFSPCHAIQQTRPQTLYQEIQHLSNHEEVLIAERKIRDLVTITTKTFLRYDKVRTLLKSIRQYYPDIKVIVADDNKTPGKIEDPNVEQYMMPFTKGWFAGRNLAVSQVTTKYFLWVDDDFLFTSDTKIEKLVDVLEATDLDLVAGDVAGSHLSFTLILEEGEEDGDCLHWRKGGYHTIPGFPNCIMAAGVENFFLAHPNRILGVGFDPKLSQVAHSEFFIDGLGRLRVGSCSHVSIGHQKKENSKYKEKAEKMNTYKYCSSTEV